MTRTFYIIGITDERSIELPGETVPIVARSRIFSGGKRHHDIVKHMLPAAHEWIDITVPLDNVFDKYRNCNADIVVFASGDPLFFGFANTVLREMPEAHVKVFPAFNSLQMLAHKTLLPYHDMRAISLTGRSWKALDAALIRGESLIGSLTDKQKTPAAIAARMLEYGYANYTMTVGECLGNEDERISEYSLEEAAEKTFRMPNCIILRQTDKRPRPFGIPEEDFAHLAGRPKMITKMPIRLTSLAMLGLEDKSVMWDIGSCTGSVSVEAKLRFPELDITAFEIREEGGKLMQENCRRFGTPGIEMITGDFMETDTDAWPQPDAVFIGGHGGRLKDMVRKAAAHMHGNGTVVFNSVSEESRKAFEEACAECGLQLCKTVRMAVDDNNPIYIMKALKP